MRDGNALTLERAEALLPQALPLFAPPQVRAGWLPAFGASDWNHVPRAFDFAPCCVLRQAWLANTQSEFQPAFVRVGLRKGAHGARVLWLCAELRDLDIHSDTTGRNQPTWELGDVFEIFLWPADSETPGENYFEFHVTPCNQTATFQIPHLRAPDLDPMQWAVAAPLFESWTRIVPDRGQWQVLTAIPLENLAARDVRRWKFSFSRYDATRGQEPVLSSSSPHQVLDFHRSEEWGELFLPA